MITGLHTIIYSDDAAVTRAFLRDVLGWPFVDGGGGWLIFKTPPAEMGVHPATGENGEQWATPPHHDVSLMCDDIHATIADLSAKGVEFTSEVVNQGFGLVATFAVPAAGEMMLYQAQHPEAFRLEA